MKTGKETGLFQIGDAARMYHVSTGTLRHYEQLGLLEPEYTDPETGYRYYSYRQFEVLNTILYLRALDMPLSDIRDFRNNKDTNVITEKLLQQKEAVAGKRHELEQIERKIDHRLTQLYDAQHAELGKIEYVDSPSLRIVVMQDSLQPKGYLDLEQPIRKLEANQKNPLVFLGKVGLGITQKNLLAGKFDSYDLVFLQLDAEDEYEGRVETCPAGKCVLVRFRGSHTEALVYYKKLLSYIGDCHLKISAFSREITLIDYGITNDTSKFVTEIRIPVTEGSR